MGFCWIQQVSRGFIPQKKVLRSNSMMHFVRMFRVVFDSSILNSRRIFYLSVFILIIYLNNSLLARTETKSLYQSCSESLYCISQNFLYLFRRSCTSRSGSFIIYASAFFVRVFRVSPFMEACWTAL